MRNFFSIISAAALLGVALGVTILIFIMSVMDGFEAEVKNRLLAFSPHISLKYIPEGEYVPIENWQEIANKIKTEPGVKKVAGTIDDTAIIGHGGDQEPVAYRGINTEDPEQVASLEKLLTNDYGESTADMGLETQAVILESRARQFGIKVGDVIQLYSTRNLEEVFAAYERTERPRASEEFQQDFLDIIKVLKEKRISGKPLETYLSKDLNGIYNNLVEIIESGVRTGEANTITDVLKILDQEIKLDEIHRQLPKGSSELIEQYLITHLSKIDNTVDDNAELKKLKSIILPQDVKIVGVYRISQQVVAPDFFMPIPLAQELSGLDSGIHAISLRLHEADDADNLAQKLINKIDGRWHGYTWTRQYADFFSVVVIQKRMMAFVLSIVSIGAAFLITIVMFITALQKKKEVGVMLAVGAQPIQICLVFLIQGIVIGALGVSLGIAGGLLLIHFREEIQNVFLNFGVDLFSAQFQGMDAVPADTNPKDVILISIFAFLLSSIAPLLPAIYASLRDPAKSLRDL